MIAFDSTFTWAPILLGRALLTQGRLPEAMASLERAYQMEPTLPEAVAARAQGQMATGREEEARASLEELTRLRQQRHVAPLDFATVQAALGDRDAALDSIEAAYQQRSYLTASLARLPFFAGLHAEPRFQTVLRNLRLAPQKAPIEG